MSTIATATSYLRAGLSVLPADPDGKRPRVQSWKEYQATLPTEQHVLTWFFDSGQVGVCIITGAVSGNLLMMDFDFGAESFVEWRRIVDEESPGLFEKLVIEKSKSGGKHVIFRCQVSVGGNQKLAQKTIITPDATPLVYQGKIVTPRKVQDRWEAVLTLIETRGEGGLFLCDPTPGYELEQGRFLRLPVLIAEEQEILVRAAACLNEHLPEAVQQPQYVAIIDHTAAGGTVRPGDDFGQRGDVPTLLIKHGWKLTGGTENQRWRRPGKKEGWSATLKNRVFYNFSSNAAPFETDRGYGPFAVYAMLEHGGNWAAAASALRHEGFGGGHDVGGPVVDLSEFKGAAGGQVSDGGKEEDEPEEAVELDAADPGPFPEALMNVPGFIGEVVKFNLETAIRQQPVLALAGAIALLAVLTARKVRDGRGNRTNVYIIANAGAGKGKDHARKINRQILEESGLLDLEGTEEIASDAGLLTAVESTPAVLFQIDEFGRFLQTAGDPRKAPHLHGVLTLLMKLYSCADTVFKGKSYANSKQNKVVHQPCVILYATTVPESFYESLTAASMQDGFMARMMVFDGTVKTIRQHVEKQHVPASILACAKYWGKMASLGGGQGNLVAINPAPGLITTMPEARKIFDDFANMADAEVDVDRPGQTLWARAEEKACRLALIYACSANPGNPIIDADAARWATDLASYCTRWMIFKAQHWVSENPFDAKQKRIIRILRAFKGKITRADLYRKTRSLSMKERDDAITNMLKTGQLHEDVETTKTKTKTVYRLKKVRA